MTGEIVRTGTACSVSMQYIKKKDFVRKSRSGGEYKEYLSRPMKQAWSKHRLKKTNMRKKMSLIS